MLLGTMDELQGEASYHFRILGRIYPEVILEVPGFDAWKEQASLIKSAWLIVDTIFGTGINKPIGGFLKGVIADLNFNGSIIVSVDIASGINGSNGKIMGCAIRASKTYTISMMKLGHVLYPGAQYSGVLEVIDIGFSEKIYNKILFIHEYSTFTEYVGKLPLRDPNSHKGSFGHAFIISGSRGKTGASILCALACARVGAGLVTLAVPEHEYNHCSSRLIEVMKLKLEANEFGQFQYSKNNIENLSENLKGKRTVVFGPGVGISEDTTKLMVYLLKNVNVPLVIDADGINVLVGKLTDILKRNTDICVLTPHPGEMARLIGVRISDILENRVEIARKFAINLNIFLVLKGARTITACPNGLVWINSSGNPGMASGGMGDVLAGLLGGFLAQGLDPYVAVPMAVFVHGLAGDRIATLKGQYGLLATDLFEQVPSILQEFTQKKKGSYIQTV